MHHKLAVVHKAHIYSRVLWEYSDKSCAFAFATNEFMKVEGFIQAASVFLLIAGIALVILSIVETVRQLKAE